MTTIACDRSVKIKAVLRVGLFALMLGTTSQAFDLDSLLVKSVGGPGAVAFLRSATSYRATGTLTINSMAGRFEEYFVPPDRILTVIDLGGMVIKQGYDGHTAWKRDQNGSVSKVAGLEKRELIQNVYSQAKAHLFPDRMEGSVEYLGDTTINDTAYHQVAFAPLYTDTFVVLFDTESGLARRIHDRMDNLRTVTRLSNYRPVSGVQTYFYSSMEAIGVPIATGMTIDTVIYNSPVDPTIFLMPGAQVQDFRFPKDKTCVEIAVEYQNGWIFVPVSMAGHRKTWFILDSGASGNVLHSPVAADLHYPKIGTLPSRGVAGFDEVELVQTDSLCVGELTLLGQVTACFDLADILKTVEFPGEIAGILGYDFLSRFPILIDYAKPQITVYDPATFVPPDSGVDVPFHLTMQVPVIACELNGLTGDYLVDLGNQLGLVMSSAYAEANELEASLADVGELPLSLGGVGGAVKAKSGMVQTFRIGDVVIDSLRVVLPEASAGVAGSQDLAGNIGNLILENFRVLFDYGDSRLILYEREEQGPRASGHQNMDNPD